MSGIMGVKSSVSGILLLLLVLTHFGAAAAQAATLDQVKARGELICGANPHLAGFRPCRQQWQLDGLRCRLLPCHRRRHFR